MAFGMPREAILLGATAEMLPFEQIAPAFAAQQVASRSSVPAKFLLLGWVGREQ